MKSKIVTLLLAGACTLSARADFNPVPLTPGSFTADVIVESNATRSVSDYTTLTMDQGTNNYSWVWMEQGVDPDRPTVGLPTAGSTFAAVQDAAHSFKMPATYTGNCAIALTTNGIPNATLTVSTPVAATAISILNAGGGASTIDYTIHYQGGGTQSGQLSVIDWHNLTPVNYAWVCNGRFNTDNGQTGETWTGKPRMFYSDISLTDTVNPVVSIDFHTTSTSRVVIFGLSTSTDNVNYAPVTISGFNRDVVVEAAVQTSGSLYKCNVIMDNGVTNITGNTWYEVGFNTGTPSSGIPLHGSNVSGGTPLHTFTMPPTYIGNDVLYLGNYVGYTSGTLTLTTPTAYTRLSFLDAAGNGPLVSSVTVHFADSSTETYSISILDWFNNTPFYTSNGRFNPQTLGFSNVGDATPNPRLLTNDIALVNNTSPVTSIDFSYTSGGGRAMIFAVAGQTTVGGAFSPAIVTGFNADGIIEASVARYPHPLYTATTASMDGGTNNTGTTWYERGYYHYMPNAGLPAAGSIIDSLAQPDHHYKMPTNYAANNCIFVDVAHTNANITFASPQTYSALSFLSCTANGSVTNQAIMQYADGTSETNTFISRDWFDQTPVAFYGYGRVNLDTRTLQSDQGRTATPNPRLYEAQFALGNTGSAVTNVILKYLNPTNSNGRAYVFAVSATAGAVPPIIASASVSPNAPAYEGTNLIFNAIITGGTAPITYQWQKLVGASYVNVVNGGNISGATTTNMTITGAVASDVASYRLVASNITGPVNSGIVTVSRLISPLADMTTPGDPVTLVAGNPSGGAEGVVSAIDNTIQKYLNFDGDSAAPFVGPVGVTVKTAAKGNTIVSVLRLYTANDAEGRDPADYLLEGSLDGVTYTTISSGPLALPAGRNTTATDALNPLTQNMQEVHFTNAAGYNYYKFSVNNVKDNANSTSMQIAEMELLGVVNPNPPPTFTISPTDVTANEGTTATFTSLATGPAPLTYQWYDVTAGDPGVLLGGQTSPNLSLPNVTLAQNGNRYRVVATNPNGSVTNPSPASLGAQLTVVSGPVFISQDLQGPYVFYAGRTAQLAIGVGGSSPYYQWQSNGVNLVNGGRISGANSNILTISNIQVGDANAYQVFTSNTVSAPLTSSVANVFITTAPNFHTNGIGCWQFVNGGAGPGSYFVGDNVLRMTDGANNEQRAAWFKYPMNIDGFKASFFYQDTLTGGADGFAFVIQNSAQGTNAIGGGGGGMSYFGMTNSVAVMFNIYNSSGIAFSTNGNNGTFAPTAPIGLTNGDLIKIDLGYAGSILTVTLSNTVSAATFTTNYTVGSLAKAVGTNVAFVGITAATGGVAANQEMSNFQYIPVPIASAQSGGGSVNLTWPAAVGGYGIQSRTNLITDPWSDVSVPISQVGGNNQATIPATNGASFYQLKLVPSL